MSRINTQMLMAVDGLYNKTLGDTDVCVTGQIVEVYLQDEKLFDKNLHTTTFSNGEIWTQQCRNRLQALLPLRYVQFLDGPFSEDKRYRYNVHEKFLIHKQNYPESVYFEKGGLPIL